MRTPRLKRAIILLSLITIVISGIIFYLIVDRKYSSNKISLNASKSKVFESKNLRIMVNLPEDFTAEAEDNRITINSQHGNIFINRVGTQFNNLDQYLVEFDRKTNFVILDDRDLSINRLDSRLRVFEKTEVDGLSEKIYFIYTNYTVYTLSTTSESLFDDLDQIANSFQYTP